MLEPVPNDDLIKCPNCAELIRRNAILCRFCEKGLSKEHFRSCPYCAEYIRVDATICRFCRSRLPDPSSLFNINNHPTIDKIFGPNLDINPREQQALAGKIKAKIQDKLSEQRKDSSGRYGDGVRQQVFEVIVRQALAGAPWREICAVPLEANNISEAEIEAEIVKRTEDIKDKLPQTSVGNLCAIEPASLLQTLALSRKSGTLTAERQNKVFRGFFQEGRLIHARIGRLKGIHAVSELILTWNEGYFYFKSNEQLDDLDAQCLLNKPLDSILVECAIGEDLSKKILDNLPAGLDSILETVESFDELWREISKRDLHYIDGTVVSDEDKEEIAAMSMLFTGFHNTIKLVLEMMDYWSTFQSLRAIQLLIDNGLIQNTSSI